MSGYPRYTIRLDFYGERHVYKEIPNGVRIMSAMAIKNALNKANRRIEELEAELEKLL